MAGMDDAWIRVRRAKANVQRLNGEVANLRTPYPEVEVRPKDEHGESHALVIARVPERPPKEWGLLIGDILVDLRSALDYAIYALAVTQTGQEPPPWAHRLEFPICKDDRLAWGEVIGRHKLDGVPPNAVDYIASIQTYQLGSGDTGALLFLEELVGLNKHRFIPISWSRLDGTMLKMNWDGCRPERMKAFHLPGELKDGTVLLDVVLADIEPHAKIEVQTTVATFVVIEFRGGWMRLTELRKFGPYVEHVIGELERFLTPGHTAPPDGTPVHLEFW
jgi:hypothetical protein